MNAQTKVGTAHVPRELAEKVDAAAARLERSRGWIVKQALAAWVDLEEQRHQMMLEGFADIGLHHQRHIAGDLAAGAGQNGET